MGGGISYVFTLFKSPFILSKPLSQERCACATWLIACIEHKSESVRNRLCDPLPLCSNHKHYSKPSKAAHAVRAWWRWEWNGTGGIAATSGIFSTNGILVSPDSPHQRGKRRVAPLGAQSGTAGPGEGAMMKRYTCVSLIAGGPQRCHPACGH